VIRKLKQFVRCLYAWLSLNTYNTKSKVSQILKIIIMKVALYARTATKQDKNPNKSIQNQIARLTTYAKENDLTISGVYYDVANGNDFNRVQFGQMLKDIESRENKIKMIVCTSSDRFSSSLLKAVELLHKLLNAGVKIKFIDDTPNEIKYSRVESEILGTYYKRKKKI